MSTIANTRGGLRRGLLRVKESVEDWVVAARSGLYAQRVVPLARFAQAHEFARWQVTTDRVLGGSTDCSFTLKHYAHFSAGVFSGAINYSDDNPRSRGGFASFRTKADERERRLESYEALEMRIKTDGRPYILNVKCADQSPEHLWQMRIITPAFRWTTVALPFADMMFTRRGHVELEHRAITRECINGMGILLADGRNGPFRFEIQHINAIAEVDPSVYASAPEQIMASGGSTRSAGQPQVEAPPLSIEEPDEKDILRVQAAWGAQRQSSGDGMQVEEGGDAGGSGEGGAGLLRKPASAAEEAARRRAELREAAKL